MDTPEALMAVSSLFLVMVLTRKREQISTAMGITRTTI